MKTTMQENRTKKRAMINTGKRLLIILFSLGLAYGASAQRGHVGGGYHGGGGGWGSGYHGGYSRTYVGIGLGYGFGYPWGYWGYPYGGYGPWGPYPAYYYGYGAMPTKLALQVEGIKNDYDAQIKDIRHDKSIPRKERRAQIDQLKHDRDAAVIKARQDYFYNSRRNNNNNNQPNNNGQQPGNDPNNPGQPKNGSGSSSEQQPEYQQRGSTNRAADSLQQR